MKTEIMFEIDKKIDRVASRLHTLEKKIAATSSVGDGGGGGGSSTGSTIAPRERHVPNHLEVKRYVSNWTTSEASLDEAEAKTYVVQICDQVEHVKAWMGYDSTVRSLPGCLYT